MTNHLTCCACAHRVIKGWWGREKVSVHHNTPCASDPNSPIGGSLPITAGCGGRVCSLLST